MASAFGQWQMRSAAGVAAGVASVTVSPCRITVAGGPELDPLAANAPLAVEDTQGVVSETITPTNIGGPQGNECTFSAMFGKPHPGGFWLQSATGGLQEAINFDSADRAIEITPDWRGSTFAGLAGSAHAPLEDIRTGTGIEYRWMQGKYSPVFQVDATGLREPVLSADTAATLPPPGQPGKLTWRSDESPGLWADSGVAWYPVAGGELNVQSFGATGDGKASHHAAIAANSNVLDCPDANFTQADVGKSILVVAAGASGAGLATTIVSVEGATRATLGAAAVTGVNGNPGMIYWGHDDQAGIRAAIAALSIAHSSLYFPAGIYLTSQPLQVNLVYGVGIRGEGDPDPINDFTGTRVVYMGAAGGAPGSGQDNALLKISGIFHIEGLRLDAGRLASYALWSPLDSGTVSDNSRISNTGLDDARYFGAVVGGLSSNITTAPVGLLGELLFDNVSWGDSGCVPGSCSGSETNLNDGGGFYINLGAGNFQVEWLDSQSIDGGNRTNVQSNFPGANRGAHQIYWASGNYGILHNVYFDELAAPQSASLLTLAGSNFDLDQVYDENGYVLHALGGIMFNLRNVLVRSFNEYGNSKQAARFDGNARIVLDQVQTSGLPIIAAGSNRVWARGVETSSFEPTADAAANLQLTSTGGIVTATTSAANDFAAGDWIQVNQADPAFNGIYRVASVLSGTQFTYADANAAGTAAAAGNSILAQGIITTAGSSVIYGEAPFVGVEEVSGTAPTGLSSSDVVTAALTNPSAGSAIISITPAMGGSNGQYLPAGIPAGVNVLDTRGGTPTFYGGPWRVGAGTTWRFLAGATLDLASAGISLPAMVTVQGASLSLPATGGTVATTSQIPYAGPTASVPATALVAGACAAVVTAAATGASSAMGIVATPATDPGPSVAYQAWVSSPGTISLRVCASANVSFPATSFTLRVLP